MRSARSFLWLLILALIPVIALAASARTPLEPLKLLRVTPGDQVEISGHYARPGQEIVFVFDRDMAALGQLGQTGNTPIEIEPAVPCQWRWLDPTTLACRLPGRQRLRPATTYRITVSTDLTALDGSHLAEPVTLQITSSLPQVEYARLQKWLSPVKPRLLVVFNLPVTKASVRDALIFASDAEDVPIQVSRYHQNPGEEAPQWLPVPGKPGVVILTLGFASQSSEETDKSSTRTSRAWLIIPAKELAPATTYQLRVKPGLETPLGPLRGKGGIPDGRKVTTYGPFELSKVICVTASGNAASYTSLQMGEKRCRHRVGFQSNSARRCPPPR